jgi:serine/threonine protein kinase
VSEAPAAQDPFGLTGTVLDRKYRVDRVVAEGGFGVVFAGHHLALDTRIAIKVLKVGDHQGPRHDDRLARFLSEARTMARLRHSHIVSVLDSGVHHVAEPGVALPWIVLEWLDGQTLRSDLDRRRGRGGRSREACMDLMRPVLEAIAYAHAHGVAHRDIKPSNIVLMDTPLGPTPRVVDFGIAKVMEREEQAGSGDTATSGRGGVFSPKYAAPEQISGARTGPWTDVHALGLVLTELLIDGPAYPSDDSTEICRYVFDDRRPTPARFGVDAGAWEPILARALALRPTDRQPHATSLLDELDAALGRTRAPWASAEPRSVSDAGEDGDAARSTGESDAQSGAVDRTFETLVTGATPRAPERLVRRQWRLGVALLGTLGTAGIVLGLLHARQGPGRAEPTPASRHDTEPSSVRAPEPVPSLKPEESVASTPPAPTAVVTPLPSRARGALPRPRVAPPSPSTSSATAAAPSSEHPPRAAVTSALVPAPYHLE